MISFVSIKGIRQENGEYLFQIMRKIDGQVGLDQYMLPAITLDARAAEYELDRDKDIETLIDIINYEIFLENPEIGYLFEAPSIADARRVFLSAIAGAKAAHAKLGNPADHDLKVHAQIVKTLAKTATNDAELRELIQANRDITREKVASDQPLNPTLVDPAQPLKVALRDALSPGNSLE